MNHDKMHSQDCFTFPHSVRRQEASWAAQRGRSLARVKSEPKPGQVVMPSPWKSVAAESKQATSFSLSGGVWPTYPTSEYEYNFEYNIAPTGRDQVSELHEPSLTLTQTLKPKTSHGC